MIDVEGRPHGLIWVVQETPDRKAGLETPGRESGRQRETRASRATLGRIIFPVRKPAGPA